MDDYRSRLMKHGYMNEQMDRWMNDGWMAK